MFKALTFRLKSSKSIFKSKKSSAKVFQVAMSDEVKPRSTTVPSMTYSISDDSLLSDDMTYEWPTIPVAESWKISKGSKMSPPNPPSIDCCRGCGQPFECDDRNILISSPSSTDPLLCRGCERVFNSTEKTKILLRFDPSTNKLTNNAQIESYFINEFCLHPHPNGSSSGTDQVYHLPLSTNYYTRKTSQGNSTEFTLCESQPPIPDKVVHFMSCEGCCGFVNTEIEILKKEALQSQQVCIRIKPEKMFEFMLANTNCMASQMQGCWSSCVFEFFTLCLGFKRPPSRGGLFAIENFQVCLKGTQSLREMFGDQAFKKWMGALKNHTKDPAFNYRFCE